jgi:NodT family efflux transporter outer membrane factor (OMF) lipoprotein
MLATALLAGCQTSVRPAVVPLALPDSFGASGQASLPERWWTSFDDPGLSEAIELALRDNFDLRSAWDRLEQARAIARSEGADLWPSVDGTGSGGRSYARSDGEDTYTNAFSLGLSMNYEVDLWGRVRSARDASLLDAQATEQDLRTAAITLSATVATTWYRLGEQLEQIRLIEQQLETNRKVFDVLTHQFRQGQTQAADVLRQRQLVEQSEGQLTLAEGAARVTRHQLNVLLGRPPLEDLGLPEPRLVEAGPLPVTGVPSELLQRRPDLVSAQLAVQAADRRLASAIADQYPRVSISASVQTGGARARDLFDDWAANLAGNLTQPLIDGGRRQAEVDRNEAVVSESLNAYGAAVLTALQEVEDALSQESYQRRYVDSLQRQLQTVAQVYDRTRDSYLNGQLDYIRVLEALVSQQSLQREELAARRELLEMRIELCRALAGPWELQAPLARTLEQTSGGADRLPSE